MHAPCTFMNLKSARVDDEKEFCTEVAKSMMIMVMMMMMMMAMMMMVMMMMMIMTRVTGQL